jgi:hypothetical protein
VVGRTKARAGEDAPPLDPDAIEQSYRIHRARRRARLEHTRERKRAGRRYWIALALVLVAAALLAVRTLDEVQRLFGL